jgi:hypothetical protein
MPKFFFFFNFVLISSSNTIFPLRPRCYSQRHDPCTTARTVTQVQRPRTPKAPVPAPRCWWLFFVFHLLDARFFFFFLINCFINFFSQYYFSSKYLMVGCTTHVRVTHSFPHRRRRRRRRRRLRRQRLPPRRHPRRAPAAEPHRPGTFQSLGCD